MGKYTKSLGELEIGTFEVAERLILKNLINSGLTLRNVIPINNHRYSIVQFKEKNILVTYKREVFYNFGLQFRDLGYKGVGDTINKYDIETALDFGVSEIYSVFPNGTAYMINMRDFLNKALTWENKEGKIVMSVSIHELKKVFEL